LAIGSLMLGLPLDLSAEKSFGAVELTQLAVVIGLYLLWLAPLDFLGGYWLPKVYQKSDQAFGSWFRSYVLTALVQASVFWLGGSVIVLFGQTMGRVGSLLALTVLIWLGWSVRHFFLQARTVQSADTTQRVKRAVELLSTWQISVSRIMVVGHVDRGFTGGIIGLGANATIVLPQAWLSFSNEELATVIARRAIAISTGSYRRGLIMAFAWNVIGFFLCSLIPDTGVATMAGLVQTLCWFTLWSFSGLLVLPTVSRNACLMIDDELERRGVPADWIANAASSMDQLQDDEPQRPRWIEAIFHPVPSVHGRVRSERASGLAAWNVARTTLFFSWAGLGFLSRSVHCNLGRPELWTMLPTD
jgi:hypothetical protein